MTMVKRIVLAVLVAGILASGNAATRTRRNRIEEAAPVAVEG